MYGINTGFGKFATVPIEDEKLALLQRNLIVSHAAGAGAPLSPERTRMMFTLRINVLAKGYSGIRPETLRRMIAFFNADCLSLVPEKGTVGASGVRSRKLGGGAARSHGCGEMVSHLVDRWIAGSRVRIWRRWRTWPWA